MVRQTLIRALISFLRWALARLASDVDLSDNSLSQAAALSTLKGVNQATAKPLEPIRFVRRTYAQEQAEWEWQHNKRAREIVERRRAGFL